MNNRIFKQALLVDDEAHVRAAAVKLLHEAGYDVHVAHDGAEGLSLLESGLRASIILIDLFMPRLDAVGFRRQQLTRPGLAEIPTVIMTTTDLVGVVAGSIGLPLLKKPFDKRALEAAIRAAQSQPAKERSVKSSWL